MPVGFSQRLLSVLQLTRMALVFTAIADGWAAMLIWAAWRAGADQPYTVYVTHSRLIAVALVSVGVGVAPMTMSPFAAWLITQMDWRAALAVIALLVWATLIPAALFARRPPAIEISPGTVAETTQDKSMTLREAFVSWPFIVLAVTFFACCAAHAGPRNPLRSPANNRRDTRPLHDPVHSSP